MGREWGRRESLIRSRRKESCAGSRRNGIVVDGMSRKYHIPPRQRRESTWVKPEMVVRVSSTRYPWIEMPRRDVQKS
jgi:hypothetical protein